MSRRLTAVLGTGSIGMRQIKTLAALPGAAPLAVPVRSQRLPQLRKMGLRSSRNLAEAARSGSNTCIIATDTSRHSRDARAALKLGFHALVEKPLARNVADGRPVLRSSRAAGRKVFVGCVLRFSSSLRRFRSLLPRLGRLHSVQIECRSYLPDWRPDRPYRKSYSARAQEGGVLRDLIHEIDYAGWIFGWPRSVSGRLVNLGRLGIAAEEIADLEWRVPKGFSVCLHLDYLTRPTRRGITAFGERGTLEWDAVRQTVTLSLTARRPRTWRLAQTREDQLALQARAFLSASRGKAPGDLATAADGMRALSVCDAARRSSRSGRAEKMRFP